MCLNKVIGVTIAGIFVAVVICELMATREGEKSGAGKKVKKFYNDLKDSFVEGYETTLSTVEPSPLV